MSTQIVLLEGNGELDGTFGDVLVFVAKDVFGSAGDSVMFVFGKVEFGSKTCSGYIVTLLLLFESRGEVSQSSTLYAIGTKHYVLSIIGEQKEALKSLQYE